MDRSGSRSIGGRAFYFRNHAENELKTSLKMRTTDYVPACLLAAPVPESVSQCASLCPTITCNGRLAYTYNLIIGALLVEAGNGSNSNYIELRSINKWVRVILLSCVRPTPAPPPSTLLFHHKTVSPIL